MVFRELSYEIERFLRQMIGWTGATGWDCVWIMKANWRTTENLEPISGRDFQGMVINQKHAQNYDELSGSTLYMWYIHEDGER